MSDQNKDSAGKCPVTGASHKLGMTGSSANQQWWPGQLNLKMLHQNPPTMNPYGEKFNYAKEFKKLDYDALKNNRNYINGIIFVNNKNLLF